MSNQSVWQLGIREWTLRNNFQCHCGFKMASFWKLLCFALTLVFVEECSCHHRRWNPFTHFGNVWTRPEHACPLPSPCTYSWKDVSVQIQNKNSWFWTPKVTTVYRHRVNCSNRRLTTKNLPKINVTGSSEDFALFDFSQNKLRAFPNFYFEKVPEILILNLTGNNFKKVPQAVQNRITLLQLYISYNRKFELGRNSPFAKMTKLQLLLLNHGNIKHLRVNIFKGLERLETLRLDNNKISLIEPGVFESTPSLKALSLSSNKLKTLTSEYFAGLKDLLILNVGRNFIQEIPADCFKNMPNLKTLSLERNRIKVLHEASFYNLLHMKLLDLGHNSIEKIPDEMFDKLNMIETIHLSRNKLKEMKYHQFVRMPETLKTLNLASNDLTITSFDEKVNAFRIEYCRKSLVVGFDLCPIRNLLFPDKI